MSTPTCNPAFWPALGAATLLCVSTAVHAQALALTELNTANQAELEQVAGLGPQLAERLLTARRDGLFLSWQDAQQRVKGLGPANAKKLSEHGLRINGQALTPRPSPAP